jgi:TPR repeat protein
MRDLLKTIRRHRRTNPDAEFGPMGLEGQMESVRSLELIVEAMTLMEESSGDPARAARGQARAARLLRRAADGGSAEALRYLAIMAEDGLDGGPPDPKKAFGLYVEAGRAGSINGCFQAGQRLALGRGTAADPEKAAVWFGRAAEGGHPAAMVSLGVLASEGPEPDLEAAARWYGRAAELGFAPGQLAYGMALCLGQGAPADPGRGAALLVEAANAGLPGAMAAVGVFMTDGIVMPKDDQLAAYWLGRAAEGDDELASLARNLLGSLAASELAATAGRRDGAGGEPGDEPDDEPGDEPAGGRRWPN